MKIRNLLLMVLFVTVGCATSYLKGVSPSGAKVYLSQLPIEGSAAYKTYRISKQSDVDKKKYLFQRLLESDGLQFYHDGRWYDKQDAYRGGTWLMQHRYDKGEEVRKFIRDHVARSESSGEYHLIKFPDGSIHFAEAILYNELDLIEK